MVLPSPHWRRRQGVPVQSPWGMRRQSRLRQDNCPTQLGVSTMGGAEIGAHASRAYWNLTPMARRCQRCHREGLSIRRSTLRWRITQLLSPRRKKNRRHDPRPLEKREISSLGLHVCRYFCPQPSSLHCSPQGRPCKHGRRYQEEEACFLPGQIPFVPVAMETKVASEKGDFPSSNIFVKGLLQEPASPTPPSTYANSSPSQIDRRKSAKKRRLHFRYSSNRKIARG